MDGGFVVVGSLSVVAPIVCLVHDRFLICNAVLRVLSSFAIISLRKREPVALLCVISILLYQCSVSLPRGMWSVNVVFPGHTHLTIV